MSSTRSEVFSIRPSRAFWRLPLLAAVNALDPYTVEFKLKNPLNSFPVNLVMGIVQAGSGAANARSPIGPARPAERVMASGIGKPTGCYGFTVLASDFDNDGYPDLYMSCDSVRACFITTGRTAPSKRSASPLAWP